MPYPVTRDLLADLLRAALTARREGALPPTAWQADAEQALASLALEARSRVPEQGEAAYELGRSDAFAIVADELRLKSDGHHMGRQVIDELRRRSESSGVRREPAR